MSKKLILKSFLVLSAMSLVAAAAYKLDSLYQESKPKPKELLGAICIVGGMPMAIRGKDIVSYGPSYIRITTILGDEYLLTSAQCHLHFK